MDNNYSQLCSYKYEKNNNCNCTCYCLGTLQPMKYYWKELDVVLPEFKEPSEFEEPVIQIYCNRKPQVYFRNKEEMDLVGYNEKTFSQKEVNELK